MRNHYTQVNLRPLQPIDVSLCSVCRRPDAIEILAFHNHNVGTEMKLCLSCKKLTIAALVPSKRPKTGKCKCKGLYKPPVHGE